MKFSILPVSLAVLASAHQPAQMDPNDNDDFIQIDVKDLWKDLPNYTPPPPAPVPTAAGGVPCTSTLTVTAPGDCGGCTTTSYAATATKEVDCHGCGVLTTSTTWPAWAGLCPACVEGVKTVFNTTGTSTVTSCSYAPGALPS